MPTGYTAAVQSGDVTNLRSFALLCARAFGALVMLRDEPLDAPLPVSLKPDTSYHDRAIEAALWKKAHLTKMRATSIIVAAEAAYNSAVMKWEERRAQRDQERANYESMIAKVVSWQPPEACADLKTFMLDQLRESIEFDCSSEYDVKPIKVSPSEWVASELAEATRDLSYHETKRKEEIARTAERNLWLDSLRASLVTS